MTELLTKNPKKRRREDDFGGSSSKKRRISGYTSKTRLKMKKGQFSIPQTISFENKFQKFTFFKKHARQINKSSTNGKEIKVVNGDLDFSKRMEKNDPFMRRYHKESAKRTLFVSNVSDRFEETEAAYGRFGGIDLLKKTKLKVVDDFNPFSSFSQDRFLPFSHLIFSEDDGMRNAMGPDQKKDELNLSILQPIDVRANLKELLDEYNGRIVFNRKEKEEKLTEEVKSFDVMKSREETIIKNVRNKPDRDGWITVVPKKSKNVNLSALKYGKVKPKRELSYWQKKRIKKRKREEKRKEKESKDYSVYEFQRVEKRRDQLVSLRNQFEKEKAKILKMKQKRMFKFE